MIFTVTINMPTKNSPTHQVFVDHPAKSLSEFIHLLATSDFVIAEEFHLYNDRPSGQKMEAKGQIALNQMMIGKIKAFEER